jgi:hypothetical protein
MRWTADMAGLGANPKITIRSEEGKMGWRRRGRLRASKEGTHWAIDWLSAGAPSTEELSAILLPWAKCSLRVSSGRS